MMYIGIDGGGTKTKFTLMDEQLILVDRYVTSTCHFAQVGYDGLKRVLEEGIVYLTHKHQVVDYAIGYGLCGYGRESLVRAKMETIVKEVSDSHPYLLINDVESAVAGALDMQDGITVIAGTGSIAIAKKGKEFIRNGGWGYLLGDEGSGTWIGERVLQVFTKQADGRLPKGALYELVMKTCKLENDFDIISYVRDVLKGNRSEIASFAKLAYDAANAKDETMISLYKDAAQEIAAMINTLHSAVFHNEQTTVSYIGGVFQAGSYLIEPLSAYLHSNSILKAPLYEPDIGVVKMLKESIAKKI